MMHTLKKVLEQVERLAQSPEHVFVDIGYREHNYKGKIEVVDKRRRGSTAKSL